MCKLHPSCSLASPMFTSEKGITLWFPHGCFYESHWLLLKDKCDKLCFTVLGWYRYEISLCAPIGCFWHCRDVFLHTYKYNWSAQKCIDMSYKGFRDKKRTENIKQWNQDLPRLHYYNNNPPPIPQKRKKIKITFFLDRMLWMKRWTCWLLSLIINIMYP